MNKGIREFDVVLRTLEPFRIGALHNVLSGYDNPVATVGGRVVVQGPTLKGALRAEIERHLIEKYSDDPLMKPCIPSDWNAMSEEEKALLGDDGLYRENCAYSRRDKSPYICPACYLLGAQGLMGFLRVPYLETAALPEDLYSVRIDRAQGVVAEKTNRDYQIMAKDTEFKGILEVVLEYPTRRWVFGESRYKKDAWLDSGNWSQEKIIQELVLDRLTSIDLMGGFKSKGCGKVKIEVAEVQDK